MKPRRTVRIPPELTDRVAETLVAAYARKAGALMAIAAAYREGRASLPDLLDAREELTEAEDVLDPLDWRLGKRGEALVLTAPTGLVRETLYAALTATAEAVPAACEAYEAGRIEADALAGAIARLVTLHDLFASGEPPAEGDEAAGEPADGT